jgi:hypothetical protein
MNFDQAFMTTSLQDGLQKRCAGVAMGFTVALDEALTSHHPMTATHEDRIP